MGTPDHLVCLLRNLYAGQEATVRTGHGTTDRLVPNWERSMSRLYFVTLLINLYAEYTMQNARLDESQVGSNIAGSNINNFRYADDITLMAEREEELKIILIRMKEESEKADLKLNIQKTKIMAFGPITSWQIEGEKWKQ